MMPTGVLSATVLGECQHVLKDFGCHGYVYFFDFSGTLYINKQGILFTFLCIFNFAVYSFL